MLYTHFPTTLFSRSLRLQWFLMSENPSPLANPALVDHVLSTEDLAPFLNHIDGIIWHGDLLTDRVMFLNERCRTQLAIVPFEWLSALEIWPAIIHPADHETVLPQRWESWKQGKFNPCEFRLRSGEQQSTDWWVLESGSIVTDATGIPIKVIGVITEHPTHRAARDYSDSSSQGQDVNQLIDRLPGVIFQREASKPWSMSYLSRGCMGLTGLSQEVLLKDSCRFNHLIHPEDLVHLKKSLASAQSQQAAYVVEYRLRRCQEFPENQSSPEGTVLEDNEGIPAHPSGGADGDGLQGNNSLPLSGSLGEELEELLSLRAADAPEIGVIWVVEKGNCIIDETEQVVGFNGLISDITDLKRHQAELQFNAFYDTLTQLPNRSLFLDRLERLLKRTKRRPDYCFAVFFLDLDRFKVINDSLGHRAGDDLLKAVAARLKTCLRPGDTVARLGGDEFTMLIEDIRDSADITQVSDRILQEMTKPFLLEGREIISSTSIGIALSSIGYNRPDEMLRDADIALYQAKALGKARYAIFNPGMHIHAVARLQLETDLRNAVPNHELRLYYQPIVSLESGQVEGLEVFVYWQHPERGLIGPMEFIPAALEINIMGTIGQWVVQEACQQLRLWHNMFPGDPPLFVSVNLSSQEVQDDAFVHQIQAILTQTNLNPQCLKLEISESTFLESSDEIVNRLKQLRFMGVQLCIDDFGTGYSALSYLNQFPVDVIKIDRSFVSKLEVKENLEIVRTVLTLAANLNLQVVAEGIETVPQLAQLRALGCEWGQGYCLARPLEAKLVETCLLQEPTGELTTSITVSIPRLLIHTKSGRYQLLLVGRTSWNIGRSQESSIFLSDRMVSREHAILLQLARTGDFYFVDLGSRNGSFLNGQRIEMPVLLKEGDRIRIGKTELEYRHHTSHELPIAPDLPQKLVLMHQFSKLQGEIWREILISQGISVIWQTSEVSLIQILEQLEAAGEKLPDLLLLDLQALPWDSANLLETFRNQYPDMRLILTTSRTSEVDEGQLKWARENNVLALIPSFNLRGNDLMSNSSDIAEKVKVVLEHLDWQPTDKQLLDAALLALQIVIRNETLY
jgi:diguanylate cyclase (GGDEF)-like protein